MSTSKSRPLPFGTLRRVAVRAAVDSFLEHSEAYARQPQRAVSTFVSDVLHVCAWFAGRVLDVREIGTLKNGVIRTIALGVILSMWNVFVEQDGKGGAADRRALAFLDAVLEKTDWIKTWSAEVENELFRRMGPGRLQPRRSGRNPQDGARRQRGGKTNTPGAESCLVTDWYKLTCF